MKSCIHFLVSYRPDDWLIVGNVSINGSSWPHVHLAMESGQLILCQGHRGVKRFGKPGELL